MTTKEDTSVFEQTATAYGCANCLYRDIECKQESLYAPDMAYDGQPTCKSYVYYD